MIDDLLYSTPELYEKYFPARGKSDFCIRVFEEYLPKPPTSVLDIGCGTGRELTKLSKRYPDCVGFDVTPTMVEYAQKMNPDVQISVGDMRSHRLGRTFDAIYALGGSINFAISNEELVNTIQTYAAHAHDGTLLLLQPLNSADFFGEFNIPETVSVPYNGSTAIGTSTFEMSKIQQVIERKRTWRIEGEDDFTATMTWRIVFPAELTYFLNQNGFEVVDIIETPGTTAYSTKAMYFVAKYQAR